MRSFFQRSAFPGGHLESSARSGSVHSAVSLSFPLFKLLSSTASIALCLLESPMDFLPTLFSFLFQANQSTAALD